MRYIIALLVLIVCVHPALATPPRPVFLEPDQPTQLPTPRTVPPTAVAYVYVYVPTREHSGHTLYPPMRRTSSRSIAPTVEFKAVEFDLPHYGPEQ